VIDLPLLVSGIFSNTDFQGNHLLQEFFLRKSYSFLAIRVFHLTVNCLMDSICRENVPLIRSKPITIQAARQMLA